MLSLQIIRPESYVPLRFQAYRLVMRCSWSEVDASSSSGDGDPTTTISPEVFVCSREACGTENFERVALPADFVDLGVDATAPIWRTSRLDLWLPTKDLADALIQAVVADVQAVVELQWGRRALIVVSGASV